MNAKEAAMVEACAKLREWIKPGDTVYTILRHVSRSGMMRVVSVVLVKRDENGVEYTLHPNHAVSKACGYTLVTGWKDGVKVRGCGLDAGFEVVDGLAYALWPDGFGCVGEGCPSNDHNNGDRDYTPHGNGMTPHLRPVIIGADHWHASAGSALRQRWL